MRPGRLKPSRSGPKAPVQLDGGPGEPGDVRRGSLDRVRRTPPPLCGSGDVEGLDRHALTTAAEAPGATPE